MFVADLEVATTTAEEGLSPFPVAAEKTTAVAGEVVSAALEGPLAFHVAVDDATAVTGVVQEDAVLGAPVMAVVDAAEEGMK